MISDITREIVAKTFDDLSEAEKFWLVAEIDGWEIHYPTGSVRSMVAPEHSGIDHRDRQLFLGKDAFTANSVTVCTHFVREIATNDLYSECNFDYTSDLNAIRRIELTLDNRQFKTYSSFLSDWVCRNLIRWEAYQEYTLFMPQQMFEALARTIHQMHQEPK